MLEDINHQYIRCPWCFCKNTEDNVTYQKYHDTEWGVPQYDDNKLFEILSLEIFQAGLSWVTILKRREDFRVAFKFFNIDKVACFKENKLHELLQNKAIVRNKLKIESVINNARCLINLREKHGSFADYIWRYVNSSPIVNSYSNSLHIPCKTRISEKMSIDLKKDGFKFLGATICYSFMQASGMVNDHLTDCFRYNQIR